MPNEPNETDNPITAELQDDRIEAQKTVLEKMNRIANKAAKRVSERLQRYDSNHGIFTK